METGPGPKPVKLRVTKKTITPAPKLEVKNETPAEKQAVKIRFSKKSGGVSSGGRMSVGGY